jgi:hypothetical protein
MSLGDQVADAKKEGYELSRAGPERVIMVRRPTGARRTHLVLALLGWWTLGVANALYALYKNRVDYDKLVIHHGKARHYDRPETARESVSRVAKPCRQIGQLDE